MKDDSLAKPAPVQKETDFNLRMDKIVDKLKADIKQGSDSTAAGSVAARPKKLGLNIDLINDTFSSLPVGQSPNVGLSLSQPNSKGSFKKMEDWISSPNASSFQLRKKIEN